MGADFLMTPFNVNEYLFLGWNEDKKSYQGAQVDDE